MTESGHKSQMKQIIMTFDAEREYVGNGVGFKEICDFCCFPVFSMLRVSSSSLSMISGTLFLFSYSILIHRPFRTPLRYICSFRRFLVKNQYV